MKARARQKVCSFFIEKSVKVLPVLGIQNTRLLEVSVRRKSNTRALFLFLSSLFLKARREAPWEICSNSIPHIMSNQTDTVVNATNGTDTNNWGDNWVSTCRIYLLPVFTLSGILINVASIGVLMKKRIRLKRTLTKFFAFLNISDM